MIKTLRQFAKYECLALRELDPSDFVRRRWQMLRNRLNRDAIFIHIPKTAGVSVLSVIERNGGMVIVPRYHTLASLNERENIRRFFENRGIVSFNHISLPSVLEAGFLNREYLQRAWKFTFVRNPFDRAVSLYSFLINDKIGVLLPTTKFSIFCSYLEQNAYEPIGFYNRRGLSQLNPQVAWLRNADGTFLCDFVGKFENLTQDFNHICNTLKLSTGVNGLPWENRTLHLPLQSYYSDREIEIVAKVYAEDFARFGYDPSRLPEK